MCSKLLPRNLGGMTKLDIRKFDVLASLACVHVTNAVNLPTVLKAVNKYKLTIPHFKPIQNIDGGGKKIYIDNERIEQAELKSITETLNESDVICEMREDSVSLNFDNFDLQSIIHAILPENETMSKFSQIGHIVHVNLTYRDSLIPFKEIIGELLLKKVQRCSTVVNKADQLDNKFRNIQLELLAGEPKYETEVVEYGIRYKLDFSEVFYNPRLSDEHNRMVKTHFNNNNVILIDGFAGIGPFAIPAAKRGCFVIANDLNPHCVKWMQKNADLNKVKLLSITCKDASEFFENEVLNLLREISEAVILDEKRIVNVVMNLPAIASNFIRNLSKIAQFCCETVNFTLKVHCYMFLPVDEKSDEKAKSVVNENLAENCIASDFEIVNVRSVAPNKDYFCVTFCMKYDVDCEPASKRIKIDVSLSKSEANMHCSFLF